MGDNNMRRHDREITDFDEMTEIIDQCDVCRLVLNDEEYPYIIPLNFGMTVESGVVTLYFHSALEGKKMELLKRDSRASFEMDCCHELVLDEEHGNCAMNYKSVIGRGIVEFVPDDEKIRALKILMKHYREENFPFSEAAVPRTAVYKLTVTEMTGKKRVKNI